MKSGIDRLAYFSERAIGNEIVALDGLRSRLVGALDRLDGRDATTLIKLGSDISRVVSAIDWRKRGLKMDIRRISAICDEETEEK
jgi:hypothetical protein